MVPGIDTDLTLTRTFIRLLLAEPHQRDGGPASAIDGVEQLIPGTIAAASLANPYEADGWSDAIDLTEGLRNDDEASTHLHTQRGIALRE